MMMRMPRFVITAGCAALLSVACGTAPRERFYTLNAVASPAGGNAAGMKARYNVAVGPVSLPEMVDRPQLVIRRGENRVDLLEQHRWAESLRTQIARVLAADLGARLGDAQVASYTDYASRNADYRVVIDIERFDGTPGDAVTVQAVWTIRRVEGAAPKSGRSLAREPVRDGGYEELAAAYARALSVIGGEIANAIR
jgi:uncharacterized lipoprotein YmbA